MIFFGGFHTAAEISCYIRHVRPHGTTAAVMIIAIVLPKRRELLCVIHLCHSTLMEDPVLAQAFILQPLAAKARVRSHDSPCEICGAQNGTVTGFFSSTSVVPFRTISPVHLTHSTPKS